MTSCFIGRWTPWKICNGFTLPPPSGRGGGRRPSGGPWRFTSTLTLEIDIEPERAHLLDEHIEALRNARLERVVPSDDRLIDLGATGHGGRFHCQQLPHREGGAL